MITLHWLRTARAHQPVPPSPPGEADAAVPETTTQGFGGTSGLHKRATPLVGSEVRHELGPSNPA